MSSGCAITSLSTCILKSRRILAWSFSTTLGGVSHFDLRTSSPYSKQVFLYSVPAAWLRHTYVPPACLHLPTCCYALDCLRVIFAQPASGVVDPGLNRSCAECLFLCCHDQCLCAVFQSSFFQPLVGFLNISHFCVCALLCFLLVFLLLTECLLPGIFT